MRTHLISDLRERTQFRQSVQARPPRLNRGSVLLLAFLVVGGISWAALTESDVVVRAAGRVRPTT